ncbi:MAG: hypothetical protein ACRDZ2_07565, partial [Ilumatobacteraceae bacterium]
MVDKRLVATTARILGVGRAMLNFAENCVRGSGYEVYQRPSFELIAANSAELNHDAVLRQRRSTQTS